MSYPGKQVQQTTQEQKQQEQPHHRNHPSDDSFNEPLHQIDISDEDNAPQLHDELLVQQLEAQFKAKSQQQPAAESSCEDHFSI